MDHVAIMVDSDLPSYINQLDLEAKNWAAYNK